MLTQVTPIDRVSGFPLKFAIDNLFLITPSHYPPWMATLEPKLNLPNDELQHHQQFDDHLMYARARHAIESDVPFINKLIHKITEYYDLTHECNATESSLFAALFDSHQPPSNPFNSNVSVFLLEVSPTTLPPHTIELKGHEFEPNPYYKTIDLNQLVKDPEESLFRTEEGTIIAGFVAFYPTYSTLLTKPGLHMEDLFVRKGYHNMGFETMLMKVVANLTVKLGYAKMEWNVITWNVDSCSFYEKIGAHLLQGWRIFRLDGDFLISFGQLND